MSATAESFAKLKRDLLFHEKRIHLLFSTRVLDDISTVLKEHITVRSECDADCASALQRLERDATEARMSGHWDEGKVYSMFQLEVPLRNVVGSNKFEPPPTIDSRSLEDLARKTQAASQRHAAFAHDGSATALNDFLARSSNAAFTASDVTRMRDAVSAKLLVIQELDDLLAVIQESSVKVAKERAQLEALRRMEEKARADGELALSEDAINERLTLLQRIVDIQFFQIHTIDSTVEANVKRQRSNLSQFQSAAAMLECLKGEKQTLVEGCERDLNRIQRGMSFEMEATDTGRGHALKAIEQSAGRLKTLATREQQLCRRLSDLAKAFEETELELKDLARERYDAVVDHVELVEGSRHATLDFMELKALSDDYAAKLKATREQHQRGVDAVEALKSLMLQGQSFSEYDFKTSARRLSEMQRRLCLELNEAANEFEIHAMEILRRKETLAVKLREEIEVANCEAETRKEIFDPTAKRYVTRARELQSQLDVLTGEIDKIRQRIDEQRTACLAKVKEQLRDEELVSVEKESALRNLVHREALLDLRQELLESRQSRSSTDIIDERLALAREPVEKLRQPKATADHATPYQTSGTQPSAPRPSSRQSTPSTASTTSRVAAIRHEVQKAKALPKLPADLVVIADPAIAAKSGLESDNDGAPSQPPATVASRDDGLELRRSAAPRVIGKQPTS